MSLSLQLNYDSRELALLTKRLNPDSLKKALSRSLNRTAQKLKTETNKKVRQAIKLKAKDINAELKIIKASPKYRLGEMKAKLIVKGTPMPLIKFSAKPVKLGVSVNVKGARKLVRNTFITKMPSGHQGVFERKGKKRLPIRELYSVKVIDIVKNPAISNALFKDAQRCFLKFFCHQKNRFI